MTFERAELPSGIRVVTARMPGQRSASVGAWVGTGSRHEADPVAGVTHFLEHLVFKGTPTRSALRIAQDFDRVGGELNAFTTRELTCFHARVLDEDVPLAVETIADIVSNALLEPDDVDAERTVVLEEIAMHEDTPDDLVFDLYGEGVWGRHALGRRILGTVETIRDIGRDDVDRYYRARYRPASIVVAAAGAVDHAATVELVERAFGSVQPGARPEPAAPAPTPSGGLFVHEREIEQAHIVYGTGGIPRADRRRWALAVLNVALGGGMSSRLWQEIREKRGLVYNVSSGHQGYADTGVFSIYAGCSEERVEEVLEIVRAQLDEVLADGISAEELARAAGHLRRSLLVSFDDSGSLMSHLGKSELLLRSVESVDQMTALIEGVTLEDVRAVARDVLGAAPWALTVLGPRVAGNLDRFVEAAA